MSETFLIVTTDGGILLVNSTTLENTGLDVSVALQHVFLLYFDLPGPPLEEISSSSYLTGQSK